MLFVGKHKLVRDHRFSMLENSGATTTQSALPWPRPSPTPAAQVTDVTMRLNFAEASDGGDYECQVSTSPPLRKVFTLNVVGEC